MRQQFRAYPFPARLAELSESQRLGVGTAGPREGPSLVAILLGGRPPLGTTTSRPLGTGKEFCGEFLFTAMLDELRCWRRLRRTLAVDIFCLL